MDPKLLNFIEGDLLFDDLKSKSKTSKITKASLNKIHDKAVADYTKLISNQRKALLFQIKYVLSGYYKRADDNRKKLIVRFFNNLATNNLIDNGALINNANDFIRINFLVVGPPAPIAMPIAAPIPVMPIAAPVAMPAPVAPPMPISDIVQLKQDLSFDPSDPLDNVRHPRQAITVVGEETMPTRIYRYSALKGMTDYMQKSGRTEEAKKNQDILDSSFKDVKDYLNKNYPDLETSNIAKLSEELREEEKIQKEALKRTPKYRRYLDQLEKHNDNPSKRRELIKKYGPYFANTEKYYQTHILD